MEEQVMANKKIRTIFMGTPEFSAPGLQTLINDENFEIVGVFTQPDKAVGRKQILSPSPIKQLAQKNNLAVFQPEKIKPEIEHIKSLTPDLILVIAYGKIIPAEILAIPTYGCINVHASLLPKYRGAACLNAPILNGDNETGVTIMKMDAGLDTGPILRQAKIKLNGQENLSDVHDKLAALGAEILVPTIQDWINGKIAPQIQDNAVASYIKILKKEDGRINWHNSATAIERLIRAYNPWPGAYTLSDEGQKTLKILLAGGTMASQQQAIGKLFWENNRLLVQCGQDSLVILKLQLAGKQPITAEEFYRGYKKFIDQILQ